MQFRARRILVTDSCCSCGRDSRAGAQYDQKLFSEMRWRCIGPFRGVVR